MRESNPLLGQAVPNEDGHAIVTGRAKYTVDVKRPGMLHGVMVRSDHAHALITSVNVDGARATEGVVDVIAPDDVSELPLVSTGPVRDMPLLAKGKVRYSGEPVAAVIATTEEAAAEAASAVDIAYEPLPVVLDPEVARGSPTVLVHDTPGPTAEANVCWTQNTRQGDIDRAFADADHVFRQRFVTSKPHAMPMETHAAVAEWNATDRELTIWSSTQQTHLLRADVARVFGLPQSDVRVIKPYVGGAFGHKEGLHSHEAMAVLGSMRTGRPVRFVLNRHEEFAATVSRNPQIRDVELAVRSTGEILGWREQIIQDVGAYAGLGPSVLALSEWVTVGPYRTPAIDIRGVCVYTNKPPASAFRGFGNPQATFTRELMFDVAARGLGMDPVDFRRRNLIAEADLPTRTVTGLQLNTLAVERALAAVEKAIDLPAARVATEPDTGVGVVLMIEWGGGCRWLDSWDSDIGSVTLTLNPDGSLIIATDAADSGQGHATVFKQMAHDLLGIEMVNMRFVSGDTAVTPYGLGTYGSRSTFIHGMALHKASGQLLDRLITVAAHHLEVRPEDLVRDGDRIVVPGTGLGLSIAELAESIHGDRKALPEGMDPTALIASATVDPASVVPDADGYGHFSAVYTCSATAAKVHVSRETGKITVLDWASAEDVGRVLHPKLLEGQIHGGTAQGIGFALGEELLFDDSGTLLNGSMVDYQVPTAPMIPPLHKSIAIESHDPGHPLGHKGIGESGITPAAAAIACAVLDAVGVAVTTLPLSPQRVAAAIEQAAQPAKGCSA
jgi:CO/xanthine dehydrogenase Mo-binding subunit